MSSRLTAAQVIGLGEYLNSDFDPASLTVSQLLGVLGFHNINFPTPYSKPKLIQLFNEEIKPKAAKFKRERIRREQSIASDDGITDGITGKPIGGEKVPLKRRSSRRLSREPTKDVETSPVRPDPPKRRRSSAQPNLGGAPRKAAPVQPTLIEESEPEEEELAVRKVGRNKKTSGAAGSEARRVSRGVEEGSGWEDNNIFQSGAESSSPARPPPSKPKTTRKSLTARKSRKSMSAPPQMSSSPPRPSYGDLQLSPPQSKFEPQLPPSVSRETRIVVGGRLPRLTTEHRYVPPIVPDIADESGDFDELDVIGRVDQSDQLSHSFTLEEKEEEEDEEVAEEGQDEAVASSRGRPPIPSLAQEPRRTPVILRLLYALIMLSAFGATVFFKNEAAPIGYCDKGSNTNKALEQLKAKWSAIEGCNKDNRSLLDLPSLLKDSLVGNDDAKATPCSPLSLIPLPHPTTCTPCPEHGTCTQHSVKCDTGHILRPHPLLFFLPPPPSTLTNTTLVPLQFSTPSELVWKVISEVTDGLPGLGSVGFAPRCLEDPKRKRNIGVLGKVVENILAQERGRRLCVGGKESEVVTDRNGGEAKRWGIEVEKLREQLKSKISVRLLPSFDDTFNEAIQQLTQWGGVFIGEDSRGKRYLAHETPNLTWNCVITVQAREIWAKWRMSVLGIGVVIVSMLGIRARRATRLVESKRVGELVQIALDTLRNQELAHHTDPITAPQPYLSSLQLRDLILQDEHSIPRRRRVWEQVERVVEGNTNVRVNLEEVDGGEEMRVWRWVGSAGRGRVIRKGL